MENGNSRVVWKVVANLAITSLLGNDLLVCGIEPWFTLTPHMWFTPHSCANHMQFCAVLFDPLILYGSNCTTSA